MLGKLLGLGEALSAHGALFRIFDHLIQHVADCRPLSRMVLVDVYLKFCYFYAPCEPHLLINSLEKNFWGKNKAFKIP